MNWDPKQYLKYADERFRPAYDLIAQIPLQSPKIIYDLGCGTGHLTLALSNFWPDAQIIGIDSSNEMLEKAKTLNANISWENQSIENWTPQNGKADIIFSNSVLHWLDNHEKVFIKLIDSLNPGGILAIQMPNNFKEPTHTTAFEIIKSNKDWKSRFLSFLNHEPVHDFSFYYKLFSNGTNFINAWESTYFHLLSGTSPVVEWVKGSFLKPLLDQMPSEDKVKFLKIYTDKIAIHYPSQPNNTTILPFKRLFLVVTKKKSDGN
jgi:trans-aconitate 2-methyltransferase